MIREELACSLFLHTQANKPCIIYSHSHSGNRMEGCSLAEFLLNDFNLCIFDYSGYGKSDGMHTTLGLKEQDDLEAVINYLRSKYQMQTVYIWGRSMGAVTALLLAHRSNNTCCDALVLDSPFASTKSMVLDSKSAMQCGSKHSQFHPLYFVHAFGIEVERNHRKRCDVD